MPTVAGRRRTYWLPAAGVWYEPHRDYVEWGEEDNAEIAMSYGSFLSDAWDEVASSQRYVRSPIESITRRIKSVVEAQGFGTSY